MPQHPPRRRLSSNAPVWTELANFRVVASLDRKRLGRKVSRKTSWARGVFDEEASRKPLAFAVDAVSYGI